MDPVEAPQDSDAPEELPSVVPVWMRPDAASSSLPDPEPLEAIAPGDAERFALALSTTGLGVVDWDLVTNQVYYSPAALEILGIDPSAAPSIDDWLRRAHPYDARPLATAISFALERDNRLLSEHRVRSGDDAWRWARVNARIVRSQDRRPERLIGTIEDITDYRAAKERIEDLTSRDEVTGLLNRRALAAWLDATRHEEPEAVSAVLCVGLDRFDNLTAGLGAGAADRLAAAVSQRLRGWADRTPEVRSASVLARLSSDQIAVGLRSVRGADQLNSLAASLIRVIGLPVAVGEEIVVMTANVGITCDQAPPCGEEMIDNARAAMMNARVDPHVRWRYHRLEDRHDAHERVRLQSDLRLAGGRGELSFEYQPIVALETGDLVGLEALMRWNHPELGLISPARFIPLAEESDLAVDLGNWTIDQVVRQIATWEKTGLPSRFAVNLNLSGQHVTQASLPARVANALARHQVSGDRLKVEITESALMADPAAAADVLDSLRSLGVSICVDDFGTGYSSLSQLHQFPIDVLKIDKSFVRVLGESGATDAIVRSIVVLAHSLGLSVVAEGIETAEAMHRLADLGCDTAQGYLFARPCSASTAATWLSRRVFSFFEERTPTMEMGTSDARPAETSETEAVPARPTTDAVRAWATRPTLKLVAHADS